MAQIIAPKFRQNIHKLCDKKKERLITFNKEKDILTIGLLGDSYITQNKVKRYTIPRPPREHICIRPHATESSVTIQGKNEVSEAAFI